MEECRVLCYYLSSSEAARRLGVSKQSILNWVRKGRLPCIETKLGRLFDPHDLEQLRLRREQARAREVRDDQTK